MHFAALVPVCGFQWERFCPSYIFKLDKSRYASPEDFVLQLPRFRYPWGAKGFKHHDSPEFQPMQTAMSLKNKMRLDFSYSSMFLPIFIVAPPL